MARGGRKPKVKGDRVEREIVKLHQDLGIPARRIGLSEQASGSNPGDLRIGTGEVWKAEVKSRRNGLGFRYLIDWLNGHDLLFLRRDGETEPWVFLPWKTYQDFIMMWEFYQRQTKGHLQKLSDTNSVGTADPSPDQSLGLIPRQMLPPISDDIFPN